MLLADSPQLGSPARLVGHEDVDVETGQPPAQAWVAVNRPEHGPHAAVVALSEHANPGQSLLDRGPVRARARYGLRPPRRARPAEGVPHRLDCVAADRERGANLGVTALDRAHRGRVAAGHDDAVRLEPGQRLRDDLRSGRRVFEIDVRAASPGSWLPREKLEDSAGRGHLVTR